MVFILHVPIWGISRAVGFVIELGSVNHSKWQDLVKNIPRQENLTKGEYDGVSCGREDPWAVQRWAEQTRPGSV